MKPGTAQSFFETSIHGRSSPVQTEPDSDDVVVGPNACTCCCRCGRIREWRPNGLRGKRRSRSYSPLRTNVFEVIDSHNEFLPHKDHGAKDERVHFAAGEAPLERLPVEILGRLILPLSLAWGVADGNCRQNHRPAGSRYSSGSIYAPQCGSCVLSSDITNHSCRHHYDSLQSCHSPPFSDFLQVPRTHHSVPGFRSPHQETRPLPFYLSGHGPDSTVKLRNPKPHFEDSSPMSRSGTTGTRSSAPGTPGRRHGRSRAP